MENQSNSEDNMWVYGLDQGITYKSLHNSFQMIWTLLLSHQSWKDSLIVLIIYQHSH